MVTKICTSVVVRYALFPQILAGSDYSKGGLFQMLLTGSLALNILSYYPINLKKLSHQNNKLNIWDFKAFQIWFLH